jgi:hypothetical protein
MNRDRTAVSDWQLPLRKKTVRKNHPPVNAATEQHQIARKKSLPFRRNSDNKNKRE